MPRISEEYRQQQRERIRQAAIDCIAKEGFEGASMSAIIARCGLSAGAVYSYYTGKQDLMEAVARGIIDDRLQRLKPGPACARGPAVGRASAPPA